MRVTITPTLEPMAHVYAGSLAGGPESERFGRYVELGYRGLPVSGYNPMTSKPVGATVEALLAIDAEAVAREAAGRAAEALGWDQPLELALIVATPGMWTDRQATTVEQRLQPEQAWQILLWFDDEVTVELVAAAASAQAARAIWWARRAAGETGAGETGASEVPLAATAEREGTALVLAGERGSLSERAAEALAVLGDDPARSSAVAFLWGDQWAEALGHQPLGLADGEGLDHATAIAVGNRSV